MKAVTKSIAGLLVALTTASAHAAWTTETSGLTTTYENTFNVGSSDGYATLLPVPLLSSYSYSFDLTATSSLNLSFWYASLGTSYVSLAGATDALVKTANLATYAFNNPGSDSGSAVKNADAAFLTSFSNLSAGHYTLTFSTGLSALKIDDIKVVVTAVPEPESYAMFLAGLGVMGAIARRRNRK